VKSNHAVRAVSKTKTGGYLVRQAADKLPNQRRFHKVFLRLERVAPAGILPPMQSEPLLQLELPGIPSSNPARSAKSSIWATPCSWWATDRISAFDCVMPNGIPRKGEVLTQLSHFWFARFAGRLPTTCSPGDDPLPARLQPFAASLDRRSMIVKKAQPLAIECVVRGYLAGSGWKEYRQSGTVCASRCRPA